MTKILFVLLFFCLTPKTNLHRHRQLDRREDYRFTPKTGHQTTKMRHLFYIISSGIPQVGYWTQIISTAPLTLYRTHTVHYTHTTLLY